MKPDKGKEPCGGTAQKDSHYSTKPFIGMKKVFHGMKRDGLPDLFEIAKKKVIKKKVIKKMVIRNQKK